MEKITLPVKTRKETKKLVKKLREQGQIPAVLYGHKIKPKNLSVGYNQFEKIYKEAGESSLIDLIVDKEKPFKALIQEVQYDPFKGKIIHVDFHQVRMDEKITTTIPIKLIGESPAVKELGGTLVTSLDEIEIECLPNDLVHEIEVDVSSLKTFDDLIHIKDLKIPSRIKVLKNEDEVVVSVTPPRTEEELKELEQVPEAVAEAEAEAKAAEEGAEEVEGAGEKAESTEEKAPEKKSEDKK